MPLVDHSSAVTGLPWAACTVKNSAETPSESEGDEGSGDFEVVRRKIGGSRGSTGLWMNIFEL